MLVGLLKYLGDVATVLDIFCLSLFCFFIQMNWMMMRSDL